MTRVKVRMFKFENKMLCMIVVMWVLVASDRSFKYLLFDTNIIFLGAIEPELQCFQPNGSTRFGQNTTTRFSKTTWPKKKIK